MTSDFRYKVYANYGDVFSKGKKLRFNRLNIFLIFCHCICRLVYRRKVKAAMKEERTQLDMWNVFASALG